MEKIKSEITEKGLFGTVKKFPDFFIESLLEKSCQLLDIKHLQI